MIVLLYSVWVRIMIYDLEACKIVRNFALIGRFNCIAIWSMGLNLGGLQTMKPMDGQQS